MDYTVGISAGNTDNIAGPMKHSTITVSEQVAPDDTTINTDVSTMAITHPDLMLRRGTHSHIPSITLSSDKTGKVDVSWGDPNIIYPFPQTGFDINWAKSSDEYPGSGAATGLKTASGDVRPLTLTGLDAGEEYKVRVRTVNPSRCGNGKYWRGAWKEASVTVASTTTVRIPESEPGATSVSLSTPSSQLAPGGLPTATFESVAGGEISVRWTKPGSTDKGSFQNYRVNWTPNDGSAYPGPLDRDGNAIITGKGSKWQRSGQGV